jgi:hypothetical protein
MKDDLSKLVSAAVAGAKGKNSPVTIRNAALARAAGVAVGGKATLCQVWPAVKAGLEILEKVVPSLKLIIKLVIAIGDKLCP